GPDVHQVEAKLSQRQHLLQAGGIAACVEAVSRLGVQRWLQQTNLVVMVERTDRKARPPGQLTHLQGLKLHGDSPGAASERMTTTTWYGLTQREGQEQDREKKVDSWRETLCR